MLYLNNPLLSAEGIISFFEEVIIHAKPPQPLLYRLYPLKTLPANFKKYKNNYLLLDERLHYVTPEGVLDTKILLPPKSLSTSQHPGKFIELAPDLIEELIALNPGHQPTALIQPPSALIQLKNKLKSIFFEQLDKNSTDQQVLEVLAKEEHYAKQYRSVIEYPRLKAVLGAIFALQDGGDPNCVLAVFKTKTADWNPGPAAPFFESLDKQYAYFSTIPDREKVLAVFERLASACSHFLVLFEFVSTKTADNWAWRFAYLLMALLTLPKDWDLPANQLFDILAAKTHQLLSTVQSDIRFYELMTQLSLPKAAELGDRVGWIQLIAKEGVSVFPYLAMAQKIERTRMQRQNAEQKSDDLRAPSTLKEAAVLAALCIYDRALQDPEFAELCYRNEILKVRFNAALDYLAGGWPKKERDNLPKLITRGKGDAERYVFVKLPPGDKRSLILGSLTECCQSIDNIYSSPCVKDGASLQNNGFYVLLKQRRQGEFDPIKKAEINDRDFDLIGQAYAWKSQNGNLCLDSIEYLQSKITNDALQHILSDFAIEVFKLDPSIKRVNVGRFGKTPEGLFPQTSIPESMLEGFQYGDSIHQYCIATRQTLSVTQQSSLHSLVQKYFPNSPDYHEYFDYLSAYIDDPQQYVEQLASLLQSQPNFTLNLYKILRLLKVNRHPKVSDLLPLDVDALNDMDSREIQENVSFSRLALYGGIDAHKVLKILPWIPEARRLEVLSLPDDTGIPLLLSAADDRFDLFFSFFDWIPSAQYSQALQCKNARGETILSRMCRNGMPHEDKEHAYDESALHRYLNRCDHKGFQAAYYSIPENNRFDALMAQSSQGETVWERISPLMSGVILRFLNGFSPALRMQLILAKKDQQGSLLHQVAADPRALQTILEFYPESERIKAVNAENRSGFTVLFFATGSAESLKYLLNFYPLKPLLASLGKQTWEAGITLLHYAAKQYNESLALLLKLYPSDEERQAAVKIRTRNNRSVLQDVKNKHSLCAVLNLYTPSERQAAIQEKDAEGNTLLHSLSRSKECLEILLNAFPEQERPQALLETNELGQTVLHCAVSYGETETTSLILNALPEEKRYENLFMNTKSGCNVFQEASNCKEIWKGILPALNAAQKEALRRKLYDNCKFPSGAIADLFFFKPESGKVSKPVTFKLRPV